MSILVKKMADRQASDMARLAGLDDMDMSVHEDLKLSALHFAAWYNQDSAVEQLIKYGADVMELDCDNATPLHYAARYKQRLFGDLSQSQELLDEKGKEEDTEKDGDKKEKEATEEEAGDNQKGNGKEIYRKNSGNLLDSKMPQSASERATSSAVATIVHLLKAGADVNARDDYGTTALFYAVLRGNIHAVRILLLQPDIDKESLDNRRLTALHIAAKYNRVEIAEILLDHGVEISPSDETGTTPLHMAAQDGFTDVVRLLIRRCETDEEKSELVNVQTTRRESPLDFAIESKHMAVFEALLPHAKVRRTCRNAHYTPLHLAVMSGTPSMVRQLLEKDAMLMNYRSSDHSTPLHKAAQYNRPRILKHILSREHVDIEVKDNEKQTPLLVGAASGSDKAIKILLDKGAKVRALTNKEQNIFHLLAKNNRPGTLEIIINYIKTKLSEKTMIEMINADDRIGNSPLHISCESGFVETTKVLMENGANLQDKNEDEETPLHRAASNGHLGVVEELLRFHEESPDKESEIIHDEDEDGNTALHLAANNGHSRVCKILIEKGAELDNSNRNLWPPLFSAVISGSVETVTALLNPSELYWLDRNKETCLHIAAKNGHVGVAEVLLNKKVSLSGINGNGQSPLDLAISFGHKDMVQLFLESDQWKDALRNRTTAYPGSLQKYDATPFRKLIQKMPEAAEKVLDRCVSYPPGVEITDPDLRLEFDFEFVDDTYTAAHWGDPYMVNKYNTNNKTYNAQGNLLPNAISYAESNLERKENHPLTHMVNNERSDLLYHPVALALIRQKWQLAQIVFLSFILFYGSYTALFTTFMISSKPPYLLNSSMFRPENVNACREVLREGAASRWYVVTPEKGHAIVYIICLMAIIGISVEAFQLYNARRKYIRELTNFLDWFTYISAIATVVPVTKCGVRTHWQWQLGSTCFFIMWINLIMFLRRMPTVGLYIVMVGEVFITFLKFFIFCFSLFLMAYGFTFFLLLQNDEQFSTPGYSFVKTTVMMIGELDYGDMFHGDDGDDLEETHLVTYKTISYALFLTFLCMVTIVIMNLLTGLAVGDVQSVQKQALLKKLALQVDLALDVECSMPEKLRRRLNCVLKKYVIKPNSKAANFVHRIGIAIAGPMSAKSIAAAVYHEYEEDLEEQRLRKKAEESGEARPRGRPHNGSKLVRMIKDHEEQMIQLKDQMKRTEGLVRKCLEILQDQKHQRENTYQPLPFIPLPQIDPPPAHPPPPPPPGVLPMQAPPPGFFFSMPNLPNFPYIDDPNLDPNRDPNARHQQ